MADSRPLKGVAPSILSADFANLEREIRDVKEAGGDIIHVDVMDGHFVPNITIGPQVVEAARRCTDLLLDVHLMIEDPDKYAADFIKAGAEVLTIHAEATRHLNRSLELIRHLGVHPGVALNPATPLNCLELVLEDVDMVLLMSVNPGFGGQKYIENVTPKIAALRSIIDERGLSVSIEVDGGVNLDTIGMVAAAGADVFVAGSAIFDSRDYKKTISDMKRIIDETRRRVYSI
jgi:ribulose-phosphate 3-epimerase